MKGKVIIHKESEPNKQGFLFYMTGTRTVITNWDEDGNYYPEGREQTEEVRNRFETLEEAVSYAKENEYEYMTM